MVQKAPPDDTARRRIADVFARLPPTDAGPAAADPPEPTPEVPGATADVSEPPVSALSDDPALIRIIETVRRPGWRGWMIRKLAGV